MALVAGDSVGPYRIGRPLRRGGIGEVYETWDAKGNARALKVFAADHGAVAFLRRRFLTEGRLLPPPFDRSPRLHRFSCVALDVLSCRR